MDAQHQIVNNSPENNFETPGEETVKSESVNVSVADIPPDDAVPGENSSKHHHRLEESNRHRTLSIMLSVDSYASVIDRPKASRRASRPDDVIEAGESQKTKVSNVLSIGSVRVADVSGAPDGGWSWVVLAAVFLTYCTMGFVYAGFSVVYLELVDIFQADRGSTGWVGSLFAFTGNILSYVFGALIQTYGCRPVALAGALIGTGGLLLSSQVVSVPYLYFTHGIVTSIGNGMMFISSMVTLQRYFDKKRALANGIGTSGLSVGAFMSAPLLHYCIQRYGLSGTYWITAGIWLQNVITASLYRPIPTSGNGRTSKKRPSLRQTLSKTSSRVKEITSRQNSASFIANFFDFSSLKNKKLIMYLAGSFLVNIGSMGFYNHFLSKTVLSGVNRSDAIGLQMTLAGIMGVSRVAFSFVSHYKCTNRVLVYAVTILLSGALITTFPFADGVPILMVYGVLQGILAGCYFCIQATVLVDLVGVSNITKTTAYFNMVVSLSILIAIPLTGFLCDVSSGYDLPFYVIGCLHLTGGAILLALAFMK